MESYPVYQETTEEKIAATHRRREYAKINAENVLLMSGRAVKINKDDDDVMHLQDHPWKMEVMLAAGLDTTEMAAHITSHMKKIKSVIKNAK
jgi:hypothetical protein